MIRAYDEYGNIIDIVEWEKHIRATAIDDFADKLKQDVMTITFGLRICDIDRIAEQLKEKWSMGTK